MTNLKITEGYSFPLLADSKAIAYIVYYDCEYNDSNYDGYCHTIVEINKDLSERVLSLQEKLDLEEEFYSGLTGGLYCPVVEPDTEGYISYKDKVEIRHDLSAEIIYDRHNCNKQQVLELVKKIYNG